MALNLNQNLKDRLNEALAEVLPTISVNNNYYLDRKTMGGFSIASNPMPEHGDIVRRLESFIGEWPFYDFLNGFISKELHEQQEYDADTPVCPLTELEQYSNVTETADRLVETFDSLPWQYNFSIKFKSFLLPIFEGETNRFKLSDTLSIVKPDDNLIEEFSLLSGIEARDRSMFRSGLASAALGLDSAEEWNRDSVYLQISTDGFVGKYTTTQTNENVVSTLKAFFGLSIALRLVKFKPTYQIAPPMHFYIHRNMDDNWIIDDTEKLSDDISRTINDLELDDYNGILDNDAKKKQNMLRCLAKIKNVFSAGEQAESLFLAGQWFFESYTGRNELLSFIQVMIALEILLGDKSMSDEVGLNVLLSNRCAYLIGKDRAQREEILKDFKEIYGIRSSIVHRGKSKLKFRERGLFNKLQWICMRVIQEEINLLVTE